MDSERQAGEPIQGMDGIGGAAVGMRLLLVNYEYPPLGGGAGNATYFIGRHLSLLGCPVAVLTSRFRGQPPRETLEGMAIYRVPVLRRRQDRCSPAEMLTFIASGMARARAVARQFRPDVCLAFLGIPSGPVAWWLKRWEGLPYAVLLRGGDVPGFLPREMALYHRLTRPFIRRIWQDAAALVANSEGLKKTAEANLTGFRIRVIPNGVDTTRFSPAAVRRERDAVERIFVGRLSPQKDIPTLLRALAMLPPATPWRLTLVGDGPDRAALEGLGRRLGLAGRLRFAGWMSREDLPDAYRSADVFVLPSRDEGMPNALLEAMASGLPVIASAVPGSQELVVSGENGFLVPPGDAEHLADRIRALVEDAALRSHMGSESRSRACRRGWQEVAACFRDLARECLQSAVPARLAKEG